MGGCDGPGLSPSPPALEHYTVTGTFTVDSAFEVVGPPLGIIYTVSAISEPISADLAVTLPYGAVVEATLSVVNCNVCEANEYTTANHDGPRLFSSDSVNLWMTDTVFGSSQPVLVLKGSRVGDTVTGIVRTQFATSHGHTRTGTFSAVRHQ
jgi:hypothetical protein